MISCKKAVELLSKQMDEPLSDDEKKSLAIHMHICEFCEQFRKHALLVRDKLRGFFGFAGTAGDRPLSDDAKAKIEAALKARLRQK